MPSPLASRLTAWRPVSRPPRRLWVPCIECGVATLNEDRHLRGWQESAGLPRVYRCAECARRAE